MRIKIHNLVFDETDPLCRCILTASQGQLYAFIQAVDTGFKGDLRIPKQYWGMYSHDEPRQSIVGILENGGKWPSLPTCAVTSNG